MDWCETLSWVLLLNSVCLNHDETEYQYKLDCLNCKEMFEKNFVHSAGNVAFRETLLTVLAQCLFDWNFLFTTNFSWYTVNHPQFFHWQARTHPLTTSTPPPTLPPPHPQHRKEWPTLASATSMASSHMCISWYISMASSTWFWNRTVPASVFEVQYMFVSQQSCWVTVLLRQLVYLCVYVHWQTQHGLGFGVRLCCSNSSSITWINPISLGTNTKWALVIWEEGQTGHYISNKNNVQQ